MTRLIQKARSMLNQAVVYLRRKIEYLWERLDGYFGLYRVDTEHVYSPQENELIDRSVVLMQQFFPESPGSMLLQEDFESRCEVIEDFANRLIQIYGLRDVQVIITDDPEVFPLDDRIVYGLTLSEQRTVLINANLLSIDNEDVLAHLVGTVIHELRHIMQYEIMMLENTRGVPYTRRKAWRYTSVNYIDGSEDMEAYSKQSIEFDARNFTNRIWQGTYGKCIPLGGR